MKYYETFAETGFHSAIMTTFAFGAEAFENVVVPRLRSGGCRNIIVLADRGMEHQAAVEFGPPRYAGALYHLVPVAAPEAFHPKITMLLGARKGRLMIGSANMTALGLGGNKELVSSIRYDEATPNSAGLFAEIWRYMQSHMSGEQPGLAFGFERALRQTPWLDTGETNSANELPKALYDRPGSTFLEQIVACIGDDRIRKISIVSPYWDTELRGLKELERFLAPAKTHLLLVPDQGFPVQALSSPPNTELFDLSRLQGGDFTASRFLHAKLIIAEGDVADHVVVGSMNCTSPALLAVHRQSGNAEVGLYHRVAPGTALTRLGLAGYTDAPIASVNFDNLPAQLDQTEPASHYVGGGTLSYQMDHLSWTPPRSLPRSASIMLFDKFDRQLGDVININEGQQGPWHLDGVEERPRYGIVTLMDGRLSAPIFVIDVAALDKATSPLMSSKRARLANALDDTVDADVDLVEILNQLEDLDRAEAPTRTERLPAQRAASEKSASEHNYATLSYEAFVHNREARSVDGHDRLLGAASNDLAPTLVSNCLNRLVGIMSLGAEVSEIETFAGDDDELAITEPTNTDEDFAPSPTGAIAQMRLTTRPSRSSSTAPKVVEVVDAYVRRCGRVGSAAIQIGEIVRARLVLQVVLDRAAAASDQPTLPVYDTTGIDWPRLVGRIVQAFIGMKPLQHLAIDADDSNQLRLLECLAFSTFALGAAMQAVTTIPEARVIQRMLAALSVNVQNYMSVALLKIQADEDYYSKIGGKIQDRYRDRLSGQATGEARIDD